MRLVRVFPRHTKATPNDALAYFGPPDLLAHDLGREDSGLLQHPCGPVTHTGRATDPTLAWFEWRQRAAPATAYFFRLFYRLCFWSRLVPNCCADQGFR
jgi:hypothetical protein